ncbi:MAG: gamma-glutamylcyclotransferase [Betaproteobacteria bacterium]|jgi:cation transport regulator ChaC|nr:MAG: gamma-glutamylcyclotransferase [Betaproteobacteria bacterium]
MKHPTWVFGYGSLIWRQDFAYIDSRRAYIDGWARRFWQGSHDHRGVHSDPGRVVTLVEAPGKRCHGRAFLIEPHVFEHLDEREINGYERNHVEIYFDGSQEPGVVYRAALDNFAFLGDAPLDEMVAQIKRCAGKSGRNIDYVLELAQSLRELDASDPHVFELEALIRDE